MKSFKGIISVYSMVWGSCMNVREISNVAEASDSESKSSMNKLEVGLTLWKMFLEERTRKRGPRFS